MMMMLMLITVISIFLIFFFIFRTFDEIFFFLLDPAIVPTQIPGYSPVTQSNYRFVFIIQAFDLFSIFECLL